MASKSSWVWRWRREETSSPPCGAASRRPRTRDRDAAETRLAIERRPPARLGPPGEPPEGRAGPGIARFEPSLEPFDPLLRGAVGERLGLDPAPDHPLE